MKKTDEAAPTIPPPKPADKNEIEMLELKKQLEECNERWKRALADYQNLEKRVMEERGEFAKFAVKFFLMKLLAVIDDFDKAQTHLKDQGLTLALKKLTTLLKEEGVERMQTIGKIYDIHSMEAISTAEGGVDNQVVEEFQAGYTLHGAVLRAAKVKVSKKKV